VARYSIAFSKAAVTAAGAIVDLATAATDRARVLELGWTVAALTGTAPSASIGLSRSTAVGTRTTPTSLLAEDAGDPAGTTTSATAFSVAPTLAAAPLRRLSVNAVGAGIVWTWPDRGGLIVPVSSSLVLHAVTVGGTTPSFTIDGYIVVDE
jgi:hypothetical protein